MISIIIILLMVIASSGCTIQIGSPPEASQTASVPEPSPAQFAVAEPSTVYVEIRGSEFWPRKMEVVEGTTVKWRNFDSGQHAIMMDNVTSPPFGNRESWSFTFNKTGSYIYNSSIHPWMTPGLIVVK